MSDEGTAGAMTTGAMTTMDFRVYDTAFVSKLGASTRDGERGYWLDVPGAENPVPLLFDEPEEWWIKYTLPAVNVRRVDLVPDPSRFLPGFRAYEKSESTPNTYNRQVGSSLPITLLYEVQMAADRQHDMNALLTHTLMRLPVAGYGTTINAFGHAMPFRANSIRNMEWNRKKKDGRLFMWSYTYAVDAWIASTQCEKVPQILQVDVTLLYGEGEESRVRVETQDAE